LKNVIDKYSKKYLEKKGEEILVVAVIGYSNVGKSSLINQLVGKAFLSTSS